MKYNKFYLSQNSGITLVALVVSIIIVLILAGITLSMTLGNQGVVDRSEESTTSFLIQAEKQEIHVAFTTLNSERLLNENVEINAGNLEKQIQLNGNTVVVVTDESDNFVISFTKTGHQYIMTPSGEFIGFYNIDIIDGPEDPDNPDIPDEPEDPNGNLPDPTDIYVTLYTDNVLSFSNTDEKVEGKTVSKSYGNIKGAIYENSSEVPWASNLSSIAQVTFENKIIPTSTRVWFCNCTNLTQINNIENLNTSRVTSMRSMFYGCNRLRSLDLSSFDTSNVESMHCMFYNCNLLNSIDDSSFKTPKTLEMRFMFYGCDHLTSLDLSSFGTSNVTDLCDMFYGCTNLTSLNLSSFSTPNAENMSYMFYNCKNLRILDLSSFDTSNVTDMSYMFYNCSKLGLLNISSFNTTSLENMTYMFYNCEKIQFLDLRSFNTSNVTNMTYTFGGTNTQPLTAIYISDSWSTAKVPSNTTVFSSCGNLYGGNKTKYNYSYRSPSRACGDLPSQTGYMSLLNDSINSRANNTEVDYLESTGSQYIDTLYFPTQNTKLDLVMESIDWGEFKTPFGVRTADNSTGEWVYTNRYAIWLYNNQHYFFHIGKDENRKSDLLNHLYTNTKFHLTVENGKLTIQDVKNNYEVEVSQFDKVNDFQTEYSLTIGALNNGSIPVTNQCKFKLYSCKIYEGNTLVRDFVPVYNTVVNQPGLYDNVEGRFFYGMGATSFSYPQ